MYNITDKDIIDCIDNCNSAMTVKGQIIGYAISKGGKNIENRSRIIKPGWYALHIGGSRTTTIKHLSIYTLIGKLEKDTLPPRSSIIGCFKISGSITESENKWFLGPIGNIIEKYIHFDNPILNIPGHQSITYRLETIDKKIYKKTGQNQERIRSKIVKELKNQLVKTRINII